jgi:hypothetical protein
VRYRGNFFSPHGRRFEKSGIENTLMRNRPVVFSTAIAV